MKSIGIFNFGDTDVKYIIVFIRVYPGINHEKENGIF